jgi:formate hydrogenlyase transcriptional activator
VCNILVRSELFQMAWFGYAAPNTRRIGEPIAWSGDKHDFFQELKLAINRDDYDDPASVCIRTGDACWIRDLAAHPGLGPTRSAFLRCGYTSVISVPLVSQDNADAALTLYYDNPEAYDEHIVSVLKEKLPHVLAVFAGRSPTPRPRSEELEIELRNLIDVLPLVGGLCDANGMLIYLNRRHVDYCGFSLEEHHSGAATAKYIHPDDYERVYLAVAAGFAGGVPFEYEVRNRGTDGHYRWFLSHVTPIRDEDGQIIRWCFMSLDIEERRQAEERIRQSEREARQLVDLSPLHITLLGPDGNLIYNNRAVLDYYGLTLEAWQGSDTRSLIHPQDAELGSIEVPRKFLGGVPFEVEMRLRRRDGQYRWFQYRFSPMVDEQGCITRWYGAGTDIDDRKAAAQRLQDENVSLREELDKASMFEEIVGTSEPLKKVVSRVSRVAPTDSGVLITGETGTGKELVARAIHRLSRRSQYPFVSVNCAAIPRDLIASELFGHEKGAFTGATQRRSGRFELAASGTIFLDEVGELPAETQVALLRVLQEREFERVGGTGSIQTDVRVIAATNRDLERAIAGQDHQISPGKRTPVFLLDRPEQPARLVRIAVVPPAADRREALQCLAGTAAPIGDTISTGCVPRHADHLGAVIAVVGRPPRNRGGQKFLDILLKRREVDLVESFGIIEVIA